MELNERYTGSDVVSLCLIIEEPLTTLCSLLPAPEPQLQKGRLSHSPLYSPGHSRVLKNCVQV